MDKMMKSGPAAYQRAIDILSNGGIVALPTETVYGLAALASDDQAVMRIYSAKGRPAHNPLILHVASRAQAARYGDLSKTAETLMAHFWPGALTMVVPRKALPASESLSPQLTAGLPTIAVRQPRAAWMEAFIGLGFMGPLVMPSANRSGHVSPTTAQHVAEDLGARVDLIIDGGPCPGGIESTIIRVGPDDSVTVLRPGAVPKDALAARGISVHDASTGEPISAPGMLQSHYAPKARLRLGAQTKRPGEAYLGFGPGQDFAELNLSPSGNLREAAHNLYDYLRKLDGVAVIAVAPIPSHGIGAAINDRLSRAAADRPQDITNNA